MCKKIVAKSETNFMSSRNLALVMSGNVFSSSSTLDSSDIGTLGNEMKLSADLFCFLIENQEKVFVGRGEDNIKGD